MRYIIRVGRECNPFKAFQQIGQIRLVADAAAAADSTLFNVAFNLALIQLHGCKKCLHFFNTAELNAVGGNLMTGLPFGRLCGRLRGRCRFRFVNGRTCKRRTDAYNKYCRNDCRKNLLRRGSSVLPRSEIIAAFLVQLWVLFRKSHEPKLTCRHIVQRL